MEQSPGDDTVGVTLRALHERIRQQEILSEIGVIALRGEPLQRLLDLVVERVAEGLNAQYAKVLRFRPETSDFLVVAGVGWEPGIVGVATIGADLESPAGFALKTEKPVISNHLDNEDRFRTPDILREHGVKRAMNVILQGDQNPYGVLEVDSRSERDFEETDLGFLQGAANILGMAIDRERREVQLTAAVERHAFLLKEMNHRVKNSLAIVASILRLQAKSVDMPELGKHLEEASLRVSAIARAHQQLYQGAELESMDVGVYIDGVARDLARASAPHTIHCRYERGIFLPTDTAVNCALIVNELATNALKYGIEPDTAGEVEIAVERVEDSRFSISVADNGHGLPEGFDFNRKSGLGMLIIRRFAEQMHAELSIEPLAPGTRFRLVIPLGGNGNR